MSTSNTHQQSLADASSETRPPMVESASYIPWVSHFRRYLKRKRENRKWLNKAINEGPYVFKNYTPIDSQTPMMQTEEVLTRDDLKHYEAEIEAINLILFSIPNEIYNSMDACTTAKAIWERVERLMPGTVQNKVDRETRFNNEFDQFVVEPGEALKYVTQVRLAKRLTEDTYDYLFDYIQQFEKLVNASRAKKLEKSHDPLALVAYTSSSSRTTSPYYVTHPSLVVNYNDDYQGRLCTSSNTKNEAIVQDDRVNIQSRNFGNDGRNTRHLYIQEEIIKGNNVHNDAGNIQRTLRTMSSRSATNVQCYNCSEKGVTLTDEQNDFLVADATRMEEIEELSANICLMARIQPPNIDYDAGLSYDYEFLNEVETQSTSYVNPLFAKDNQEKNELSTTWKQNEFLNDQLLEAKLKYEIECCVLLSDECVNNYVQDEIEKIQRDSIEIQEGMQKRIKILENDVQKCQKQSLDFELQIQHEKERRKSESSLKTVCETSWISKMENIENENVSLEFKVQSLIKERENVKLEYQKLFDSIKKTRTQTQGEINELIEHVTQKTYAYAEVRAHNQDLLITISKLKAKLKNDKKGKSVNTKFDKTNVSNKLVCVTPLNKQDFQNKIVAPKTEEKHVLSKTVTLQTSPNKQKAVERNNNVIAPGMYKVNNTKKHETNTNKAKGVLSSTRLKAASSVRVPLNSASSFKNSALSNTKKSSKRVEVSNRTNKKPNVASKNVVLNKKIVNDDDVTKKLLKRMIRALFTTARTAKSTCEDTTPVVSKTMFAVKTTQSKSLDTTPVVSKTKIVVVTPLSAKNKVVQIVLWIVNSGFSKHMTGDHLLLKNFIEKFLGLGHNLFSVGQFCDDDLEVAFRLKSCYVQNLEGDDLLIGARESNLHTISISDMAPSSPVCLMSKATSTKS
ncbi:hypothetical protein Tco_0876025 [Tanacetum coccineum]|uniref:Integrase, catalytic region, zinc finger, CCHC-type, peptidase aspartic, catalytic n=1 Tax=Tanacetum coccineum TaxID=301880 RepID=A0ABQ5BWS3_9ASTR